MNAYCPGCRHQLPEDLLSYPVMGCPKCHRIIHFPCFREPEPREFERLEKKAREVRTRLHREWQRADMTGRVKIEAKIKYLLAILGTV